MNGLLATAGRAAVALRVGEMTTCQMHPRCVASRPDDYRHARSGSNGAVRLLAVRASAAGGHHFVTSAHTPVYIGRAATPGRTGMVGLWWSVHARTGQSKGSVGRCLVRASWPHSESMADLRKRVDGAWTLVRNHIGIEHSRVTDHLISGFEHQRRAHSNGRRNRTSARAAPCS